MLVLMRRAGEKLCLGSDIEISILEVRGDSVKIGIQAPRSVQVWRKEIYDEIVRQNVEAARTDIPKNLLDAMRKRTVDGGGDDGHEYE